ncbi:MAG: transcriptional regulator [Deltaproteobacteria bacterium]|nr:transcriptional regulator [Deltaproteobacteria bacterium]MBW2539581.1 transcriptional regulator [Deltaproteobacteria bacterium]
MQTFRQQMISLLKDQEMSARDLSQVIGIQEKEVYGHLGHVARTVEIQGKKLVIQPFRCLSCGYVFKNRKRFTRPGHCPACRKTHLEVPTYRIC